MADPQFKPNLQTYLKLITKGLPVARAIVVKLLNLKSLSESLRKADIDPLEISFIWQNFSIVS